MYWRSGETSKGWNGPAKVIQQDGRSSVFCLHRGTLVRAAPEHVRPVSALEAQDIPNIVPSNQDAGNLTGQIFNSPPISHNEVLNPDIPNEINTNNNSPNDHGPNTQRKCQQPCGQTQKGTILRGMTRMHRLTASQAYNQIKNQTSNFNNPHLTHTTQILPLKPQSQMMMSWSATC